MAKSKIIKVHIDFESRSFCDLKSAGPHRYAQDPSTAILCLAFAVDDEDPDLIIFRGNTYKEIDRLYHLAEDESVEFHAFNASFEGSMWSEQMVDKLDFPPIAQERWHCTASQAYAVSLPRSLAYVAQVLWLDTQKDKEGAALMRKMCILTGPTMPEIDPEELKRLGEYCKQDVIAERKIARKLPPLSAHEQAIYVVDQRINKRGILIDRPLVENAIVMIDKCVNLANAELKTLTGGAVRTIGQVAAILKFARSRGVEIDRCTAKVIDEQLKRSDLDPAVRRVFELRRSTGRAAVKKYAAMLKAVCYDGRIRDHLMYCGAGRTRRWSGQRFQTQNLVSGYEEDYAIEAACAVLELGDIELACMLFGDAMVMLSGLVRSMIIAGEDYELVVVDFSNIEARVLAVVSNNDTMLADYKKGLDPYISFATLIFNIPYGQITKVQRFFGKQAILGLGYGMGPAKFLETCANYGQKISYEFASEIVALYRDKNHMVPAMWRQVESDAKYTIRTSKPIKREYYGFRYDSDLDALVMLLPDESERWYFNARVELRVKFGREQPTIVYKGVNSITGKWSELETYGGKMVENWIQSIARQLQADAILAVDRAGLPIVLHSHDEVVCRVLKGQTTVDKLIELMTTASTWADSWPIGADGWKGPGYKKIK